MVRIVVLSYKVAWILLGFILALNLLACKTLGCPLESAVITGLFSLTWSLLVEGFVCLISQTLAQGLGYSSFGVR